jgi:hypothetical protein
MIRTTSELSRATISFEVAAGAIIAIHGEATSPGSDSVSVGTSGNNSERFASATGHRAQAARLDELEQRGQIDERHVVVPGQHIDQRGRTALIGNERDVDVRAQAKPFRHEVLQRAQAGHGRIQFSGLRLGERYEFTCIPGRYRGMHDERDRGVGEQRDGHEVAHYVVRNFGTQAQSRSQRTCIADEQRVSVRR